MVEILDKSNAPLQEIYDTVCSVVPAMADEDMYFLYLGLFSGGGDVTCKAI